MKTTLAKSFNGAGYRRAIQPHEPSLPIVIADAGHFTLEQLLELEPSKKGYLASVMTRELCRSDLTVDEALESWLERFDFSMVNVLMHEAWMDHYFGLNSAVTMAGTWRSLGRDFFIPQMKVPDRDADFEWCGIRFWELPRQA